MRFLILTQRFPPEIGAQPVRLAAMIKELRRSGHAIEVVTALPNHPHGRIDPAYSGRFYVGDEWNGVTVHRTWIYPATGSGGKRLLNYASFMTTSLAGLLRARKPDILFVESPPLFLSLPAWVAARRWKVPIVFNVADLWPDSVRELGVMEEGFALRMADRLEQWTYKRASFITAVTKGIHKTLRHEKNVPEDKLLFLPNGVDTELFRPTSPDKELARQLGIEGKKVILYAGSFGFAHGFEVALRAMERLQERAPNIHLLGVGGGSERQKIVRLAKRLQLQNVTLLDPKPQDYIARLHTLAFAGLSTLRNSPLFEGTRPAKIFVTMAAGQPVLYSGRGEGAQLVEEAQAGVVAPPEDPEALAQAILRLKDHPQEAEEMGRNGRRYVEKHYSWEALVKRWLDQLEHKLSG